MLIIAIGTFVVLELDQTATIEIDGQGQTVTGWAWTVWDMLASAEIFIIEGDTISPPVNERMPDDGQISIERAFWVLITADGVSQSLWTTERIPRNLLEMVDVNLGPQDLLLWNGLPISASEPLPKTASHSLKIRRAAFVTVADGDQRQEINSTEATLGDAIWEQGIILNNNDISCGVCWTYI